MAETHPGGRISRIPKEHRGEHPHFTGKPLALQPSGKEAARATLGRIANPTQQAIESKQQSVRDYFSGRDLPTAVRVPTGVRYYNSLDEIDPQNALARRRDAKPKFSDDEIESRSLVALSISPPLEGEEPDASFKFVGERGLYVRVIKDYEEKEIDGQIQKTPILRWVHFNEDGAKKIVFT